MTHAFDAPSDEVLTSKDDEIVTAELDEADDSDLDLDPDFAAELDAELDPDQDESDTDTNHDVVANSEADSAAPEDNSDETGFLDSAQLPEEDDNLEGDNDNEDETKDEEITPPGLSDAEDVEEVLALRYLETVEEMDADFLARQSSACKNRRRRKEEEDRPLSAKAQKARKQAKFIIYGGLALLTVVVICSGWYLVPKKLHALGYMDKPYIWPFQYFGIDYSDSESSEPAQEVENHRIYKTATGESIAPEDVQKIVSRGYDALNKAEKEWTAAQKLWADGEKSQAILHYGKIRRELMRALDILEANAVPGSRDYRQVLTALNKFNGKMISGAQWKSQLTLPEMQALKKLQAEQAAGSDSSADKADDTPQPEAKEPAKKPADDDAW